MSRYEDERWAQARTHEHAMVTVWTVALTVAVFALGAWFLVEVVRAVILRSFGQ